MSSEGGKVSIKVLVKDKRFREYRMDGKLVKEKSSLCQKYEVTRRISEIIKDKTTKIREMEQAVKRLRKSRDCWTDIAIAVNPSNEDFLLDVVNASEEDIENFEKDNFFTTETWAKLKKISVLSDEELEKLRSVDENTEVNDSEEKINHMQWIHQTTNASAQTVSAEGSSASVSTSNVPTAKEDLPKKEGVCNTASDAVKDIKCNGNEEKDKKVVNLPVEEKDSKTVDLPVTPDKPVEVEKKKEKGNEPSPEQKPVVKEDSKGQLPVTPVTTTPLVNNAQSTNATPKDLNQNGSEMKISDETRNDVPKPDESRENSKNLQISNGNNSSKPKSISKKIEYSQATSLPPSQDIKKPTSETTTGKVVAADTKQDPPKTILKPATPVVKPVEPVPKPTATSSAPTKVVPAKPAPSPTPPKPSVTPSVGNAPPKHSERKERQNKEAIPVKTTEKKIPAAVKKNVEDVEKPRSENLAKTSGQSQPTVKPQEVKKPLPSAAPVVQNIAPAQPPVQVNNGPLKPESVEFPKLTDPPPIVVKPKRLAHPSNMPRLRFSGEEPVAPIPVLIPVQQSFNNVWVQRQHDREKIESLRFSVPPPPFVPVVPQPPRFSSTPLNPNAEPFKPMFQRNQEAANAERNASNNQNGNAALPNGHGNSGRNGRKESYKKEHFRKEPVKREPAKTVDSDGWITIANKKPAQGPSGKQAKEHRYMDSNNSPRQPKPAAATNPPLPKPATPLVAQQVALSKPEPVHSSTVVSTASFAKVAANASVPSSAPPGPTQAKPANMKPAATVVKSVEAVPPLTAQSSVPTKIVSAKPAPPPAVPKPVTSPADASTSTPANDTSPKAAPASSANGASSNTSANNDLRPQTPVPAATSTVPAPTVPGPPKKPSGTTETQNGDLVEQTPVQQPEAPLKAQQGQNNRRSKNKKGKAKKELDGMSHEEMIAFARKQKMEQQTIAFKETQKAYHEIRQEREHQHNLRRYNAQSAETIANLERCHEKLKDHSSSQVFQYRLLGSRLFTKARLKELERENSGISKDKVRYLNTEEQRLGVVDHMCSFIMFMKKNFKKEVKQFTLFDLTSYLESTSFRQGRSLLHPSINAKIESAFTKFLRDTPRAVRNETLPDYITSAENFVEAHAYSENLQRRLVESLQTNDGNNEQTFYINKVFNVFADMHANALHFINKTSYLQSQSKYNHFILEEDLLLVMEEKRRHSSDEIIGTEHVEERRHSSDKIIGTDHVENRRLSSDEIIGTDHVELADNVMEWSDCDGPNFAKKAMNGNDSNVQVNGGSSEKAKESTWKNADMNEAELERSELEDGEEDIETADNSCQTEEEFSGPQEEPASSPAVKN